MYTIIIADDEREIRRALVRNIDWEAVGFQVVAEAENGAEALELVERLNPDLLLTDIKMPFLSGLELAGKIRETRPAVQIAFLSGYDDFSYAQQAIQYNIISYMLKPVSPGEITAEMVKIREKLDGRFNEIAEGGDKREDPAADEVLMPLLMDPLKETEGSVVKRWENILLESGGGKPFGNVPASGLSYKMMLTCFLDAGGKNVTARKHLGTVAGIAEKYVGHTGFYAGGKIVSLLYAPADELGQYLYIIAEEVTQSVRKILGLDGIVCVSHLFNEISGCRKAYSQTMDIFPYAKESGPGIYFISDVEREKQVEREYLETHPVKDQRETGAEGRPGSAAIICEEAIEVLNRHYTDKDISLISVSREVSVSPNYLSTLIKRTTGSTFVDLLTKRRLEKAKIMLRETDLKIWEITEQCGYNDQHYFSYCFKKNEGVSPAAYRRQYEKES